MTDHRLERIDFQRPARFVAVCSCGWRSEPTLNAGLAGALWDRHVERQPSTDAGPPAVADHHPSADDAARERDRELGERARAHLTDARPLARP